MQDWTNDPSRHERTLLPRSCISFCMNVQVKCTDETRLITKHFLMSTAVSITAGKVTVGFCFNDTTRAYWFINYQPLNVKHLINFTFSRRRHAMVFHYQPLDVKHLINFTFRTHHGFPLAGPFRTTQIVRKETRCPHIGYSFRLAARVLLYASSHWQDNTYHGLCYSSRGALTGTRNSSMGPTHKGSIRRPIAPFI